MLRLLWKARGCNRSRIRAVVDENGPLVATAGVVIIPILAHYCCARDMNAAGCGSEPGNWEAGRYGCADVGWSWLLESVPNKLRQMFDAGLARSWQARVAAVVVDEAHLLCGPSLSFLLSSSRPHPFACFT